MSARVAGHLSASGGGEQKGRGLWGKAPKESLSRPYGVKIFARPRFLPRSVPPQRDCFWGSAAAEFRANFVGAPPKIIIK